MSWASARSRRRAGALIVIAASLNAPACAGGPIDTDGPDFVESSEAVGKGRFQFETNLASERDSRRGITRGSTPTLLRYGLTETIEVRIETAGRIRIADDTRSAAVSETADTAVGLKWHAQDREAASGAPSVSWILHFDSPSGTGASRGAGIRPSLRSVITWDLARDWSLGFMPGLKSNTTARGDRSTSGIAGAVLGKRVTTKLRVFVELAAPQIARARDGGVLLSWDFGAAYLIADDWQIGIRAADGANRNTPGSAVLFALAGRF